MSIHPPNATTETTGDGRRWSKAVRSGAAILAVILGAGVIAKIISPSDNQISGTKTSAPSVPQTPRVDEGSLHPYDILRNPYAHKNHIISMDVASWPILYNSQLMQYTGASNAAGVRLGYSGIRLNRMLSENTALYDVMGASAVGGPELELLGQLAVQGPSVSELNIQKFWDVEPLGIMEGTNGFGAQIQVPQVKFWRYTDERYQTTQNPSGEQLTAINLVKARMSPTHSLMSLQPDFNWVRWEAFDLNDRCSGCWAVTYGVKVKSESTPQYDAYRNGEWMVNVKTLTVTPADINTPKLFQIAQ